MLELEEKEAVIVEGEMGEAYTILCLDKKEELIAVVVWMGYKMFHLEEMGGLIVEVELEGVLIRRMHFQLSLLDIYFL